MERTERKRLAGPVAAAVGLLLALVGIWLWIETTQDVTLVVWLGKLPVVVVFAIVAVFWVLFGLIAWWIAERTFENDGREVTHENVARLLLIMTSFFVFVLGFVVSQEWSNATAARNEVSRGAAALYTAGYNNFPLPQPSKKEIQVALDDLGNSIVCDDIPSLADTALGSPETAQALARTFEVTTDQPQSVQDLATYDNIVDELGVISEARREWLSHADNGLPTVILLTIFLVSGFLLAAFVVQSTRSRRGHLATVIILSLLIALGTGLVISLARPFGGAAQVNPDSFSQGAAASNRSCAEYKAAFR